MEPSVIGFIMKSQCRDVSLSNSRFIPTGAFRVEMARENSKDRAIFCKYSPTETGDYRIEVSADTFDTLAYADQIESWLEMNHSRVNPGLKHAID